MEWRRIHATTASMRIDAKTENRLRKGGMKRLIMILSNGLKVAQIEKRER
jgi:hypothetical protein